jgi:arabinogalactan endo-1,4-beta-galactosidase
MGIVINSAIAAIEDVRENSTIKTKIILHVADPKNVTWWFDGIIAANQGNVKNFDIIGFSYYPLWHRTIGLDQISNSVSTFKSKYHKEVMILETAYPWTTEAKDSYNNHFGTETPLTGFPFSQTGQYDFMVKLTQEVMDGGGRGVIYWEPAWISSKMKDLWGTGSSWENNTFFDFEGNAHHGLDFMTFDYN